MRLHRLVTAKIRGTRVASAVLIGCAAALACGALSPGGTQAASRVAGTPAGFKTYTDKSLHFRIAYPASWKQRGASPFVYFLGPKTQGGNPGVDITALAAAGAFGSVDTMAQLLARELQRKSPWKMTGQTSTSVAGADARVLTGRRKTGGHDYLAVVVFEGHGRVWEVIYGSPPKAYAKTWSQFRAMLASFTFT